MTSNTDDSIVCQMDCNKKFIISSNNQLIRDSKFRFFSKLLSIECIECSQRFDNLIDNYNHFLDKHMATEVNDSQKDIEESPKLVMNTSDSKSKPKKKKKTTTKETLKTLSIEEVCGQIVDNTSTISVAKSVLPDLPYKEDQWTPLNPGGKKRYDRDFLFDVNKKSEICHKMPDYLQIGKRREVVRKVSSDVHHYKDTPLGHFWPIYGSRGAHNSLMPQIIERQASNQSSNKGSHQKKQKWITSLDYFTSQ